MRLPAFVCLCLSVCQQDYSTSSSAVTKRSRDASCLSASTIQNVEQSLLFQLRRHGSLQICHCMQLNALFCCVWRNVEASCHKHFVVFFRNQHRRLLPAMCHNLRDGGRVGDPVDNTCSIAALTQAVKPDIGSESRFLPTPPEFDVPVRGGGPVRILLCRLAWKN